MSRTKNYSAHIENITKEIEVAEKKLIGLQNQLDTLIKEKETNEANAIYKYVKENNQIKYLQGNESVNFTMTVGWLDDAEAKDIIKKIS